MKLDRTPYQKLSNRWSIDKLGSYTGFPESTLRQAFRNGVNEEGSQEAHSRIIPGQNSVCPRITVNIPVIVARIPARLPCCQKIYPSSKGNTKTMFKCVSREIPANALPRTSCHRIVLSFKTSTMTHINR